MGLLEDSHVHLLGIYYFTQTTFTSKTITAPDGAVNQHPWWRGVLTVCQTDNDLWSRTFYSLLSQSRKSLMIGKGWWFVKYFLKIKGVFFLLSLLIIFIFISWFPNSHMNSHFAAQCENFYIVQHNVRIFQYGSNSYVGILQLYWMWLYWKIVWQNSAITRVGFTGKLCMLGVHNICYVYCLW